MKCTNSICSPIHAFETPILIRAFGKRNLITLCSCIVIRKVPVTFPSPCSPHFFYYRRGYLCDRPAEVIRVLLSRPATISVITCQLASCGLLHGRRFALGFNRLGAPLHMAAYLLR